MDHNYCKLFFKLILIPIDNVEDISSKEKRSIKKKLRDQVVDFAIIHLFFHNEPEVKVYKRGYKADDQQTETLSGDNWVAFD